MKLVKESVGDFLKPKSEEDVMKDFYDITPSSFPQLQIEFRKKFGKPIPTKYCPLIVQIYRDMSVSSKFDDMETISKLYVNDLGSFGKSLDFDIHGKRREIWVKQGDDVSYVMFKIHPFVKVRKLKDIIVANNYLIRTFDQYKILSEHLNKVNESVEDILRPKSKEEVDDAFEDVANRVADILLNYYEFDDYMDAYQWAIDHQEKILQYSQLYDYELNDTDDEDNDLEKLIQFILYGPNVEH